MVGSVLWPTLCGNSSAFWDTQLTWNTTDPYFTECFQRTVLVWIPCAFLWLFLPVEIYCIKYSRGRLIPWTSLNITKLVLNTLLVVTALMNVGKILGSPEHHGSNVLVDLFSPVLHLATFVLLVLLVYIERVKGVTSSGVLFFYWLFYCICGLFTLRNILRLDYEQLSWSQRFDYFIFMTQFPAVVIQFLISGFNDARPLHAHVDDIEENACPRNTASFLHKLLFIWYDKLLWKGYRTHLQSNDVWKSTPEALAKNAYPEFTKHWKKAVDAGKKPSLFKVLAAMQFTTYISLTLIKTLEYVFAYLNPILLKWLIEFVSNGEVVWHGYVYISGMLLVAIGASFCGWHTAYFGSVVQVSVQAALSSTVYRKALVLANFSGSHSTVGEIVNLMAVDIFNVTDFLFQLIDGITLPMQICVGIYMMYQLLGMATFSGLATMVILKFVSFYIAKKMEMLQATQLELKDQRVKQVNEAILGVKVLKLFAWEKPIMKKINEIRLKETKVLRVSMYLDGASMAIWTVAPAIVTLVTLITYVYLDEHNVLDASKIFVTLTIINILGSSFIRLPLVIVSFVQALVSARRLNSFLNNKELDPDCVMHDPKSDDPLFIRNGFFSWGQAGVSEKILLKNINLSVKNKSLVAIVGPVGCGKSSLISALLGEMEKIAGTVNTTGTVAYVPQQPWIQNNTLKNNILFGKIPRESYYSKVIQACALTPDLEILPGGDAIEIGENGINLSGGQKQRVSLARAVFNDADIYLLDDPLSAVDAHVGKHIFEHVIGSNGLLKNKTRVLVTHAVTYLPCVDQIVVLSKGTITEVGTYEELIAKKGDFADFITNYGTANNSEQVQRTRTNSTMSTNEADGKNDSSAIGSTLIAEENRERGNVSLSIYGLYVKYIGYFLSGVICLLMVIGYAFSAGVQNWLSLWSSDTLLPDGSQNIPLRNLRMIVYGVLTLLFGVFLVLGYNTLMYGARKAAVRFHHKMLSSVMRSPMSFFDTTPSGRIVNRFSEDIQSVDSLVPMSFRDLFCALLEILTALLVICIRLPIILVVITPMAFIYYLFQRFFMRTINQLRRLESVSKSPLYSRFSESVNGVATIRAFRLKESFVEQAEELIDEVVKFQYYKRMMFRWFGIRLDTMGGLLTFFTGLFVIIYRDTLSPGTVALVVSYSISVTYMFCWFVMNAGHLESSVVAVERIHEYISLPSEAQWDIPDKKPDSSWPSKGSLSIQNLVTRYREELEPVLHNLTCHIGPGEKIGVVGRTGAGKSSITMSLFRIIEAMEGSIVIDGVDIATVGLHDLRSNLTIIPQDPVLFSGTLRHNLDPFDRYTDDELWRALELSHLKEYVSSLSCGLLHFVSEGGSNLSVGQKQLVCLARALLRKSKILVLDEATAAVDLETDDLIQATIRKEFADSTVLTIAHRLNTIMDSTKVMVLDKGMVKEFDSPENLLSDSGSIFYSMAKQSGL